jgi:hypothetical protein
VSRTQKAWQGLSPQVADVLEPELPDIGREIVATIRREVPQYVRPLEGAFGESVITGVDEALRRFVALIRDPTSDAEGSRQVSVMLGHQELGAGRTLDALQAAYRVGARVAWRRFARASRGAGLDEALTDRLAEAIFAYIDELSAESVEGYAQAQSERAGEAQRRRGELVMALLGRAGDAGGAALAAELGWTLPRRAATLACPPDRLAGLPSRVGPDCLGATVDSLGCVIVPDAEGPGRRERIIAAVAGRPAAIGPELALERIAQSWRLAAAALELVSGEEPVVADEHLGELLIAEAAPIVERIGARRLAPLEGLTPVARGRMAATALAYVRHRGNAAAMARALHVHPQTARHRISRLRELLGEQLDDPDARFELEAALRALG